LCGESPLAIIPAFVEQHCTLCGEKTPTPVLANGLPYHPVCFVLRGIVSKEQASVEPAVHSRDVLDRE
jgi:hypothetical protein